MEKLIIMMIVAILPALTALAVAADKVELIKGLLKRDYAGTTQMLSVKNNTASTIRHVHVNCGFFHDDLLVGTHGASFDNIPPGLMAYDYTVTDATNVTNVDCRIDSVD
jgi:hypothetical protein